MTNFFYLATLFLAEGSDVIQMQNDPFDTVIGLFTALVSLASVVSVILLQVQQARLDRQTKHGEKKNSWYRNEVLSANKLENHVESLRTVLTNPDLTKEQMCTKINDTMLDFFYKSVNYIAFFDLRHYNELKQKIMAATDNIMYSVLIEDVLTEEKTEKILEIYRMKLTYLFYEYDMKIN
jgi:high-affinity Fe2+/Pb2+ permease